MKFYTRDWLDNKELRACSEVARSVLADLMCLAHEGYPYGYLSSTLGPLKEDYLAARCFTPIGRFRKAIIELKSANRIEADGGTLFIRRMVEDESLRLRRAAGGVKGGNPELQKKVNLAVTLMPELDSRERTRADSDSDSSVEVIKESLPSVGAPLRPLVRNPDAPSYESVNNAWKWYQVEYPKEVFPHSELRLFISVMEAPVDLEELRANLPIYKQSKSWVEGFAPSSENFLSKRMFKVCPKNGPAFSPRTKQQSLADAVDRL